MFDSKTLDLIDGLYAFDGGCVSSGISDPAAHAQLMPILRALTISERRQLWCSIYSPEQGYTDEDEESFLDWIATSR